MLVIVYYLCNIFVLLVKNMVGQLDLLLLNWVVFGLRMNFIVLDIDI